MKKVRRFINRASILVPLALVIFSFTKPTGLLIPRLNISLGHFTVRYWILILTVLWLCCSPLRKHCCDGTHAELFFNLVPVEAVLTLFLAQWHFYTALAAVLVFTAAVLSLLACCIRFEGISRLSEKQYRRLWKRFYKRTLLLAGICLMPLCVWELSGYGLTSPDLEAKAEVRKAIFTSAPETSADPEDDAWLYLSRADLWALLKDKKWMTLMPEERICVVQELADLEAAALGIPEVPVSARFLKPSTLGAYSDEDHAIFMNTESLAGTSVKEVLDIVCHEMYHAAQHFIVEHLDPENPVFQTSYFREIRLWAENQADYKTTVRDGYDAYENQIIERTAREYSEGETEKLLTYISGLK